MNVVLDAADSERLHVILASNAAKVGPETRVDLRCDCLAALLGAENVVDEAA